LIRTKDISFQYDENTAFSFPDFSCASKEELLILGPSGVGKTTFLHLLCGFIKADKGKVEIDGKQIFNLSDADLDHFRSNSVGIIFQDNYFIDSISVKENLFLAQTLAGNKKDEIQILKLSQDLGIEKLLNKKPSKLSRGEQQRASIIRALLNNPKVLLADEPTSSLDDVNCNKVISLLKDAAQKSGAALIIVTHDSRLKSQIKNTLLL